MAILTNVATKFYSPSERMPKEQELMLCYSGGKNQIAYIGMHIEGEWCRDGIDEWIPCDPPEFWAYIPENLRSV